MGSNKTIARNTIFLYFRMLLLMLVSLYTSRVVLQQLGVEDYGIYEVVGGVVGLLSFLSGALSAGSSRFLSFELGKGDKENLKRYFSTIVVIHYILAIIIILLIEYFGIWMLHNKLSINDERMDAAVFAFHISVLTSFVSITQIPYTSSVISHERMGIYAYMGIVEVGLKLAIVYILPYGGFDKLKYYALLLFLVQLFVAMCYRRYCLKKFEETKFQFLIDWSILKNIISYSFWNLFTNITQILKNQGVVVLISMFFSPQVVTARALANRINMAANQFADNFRVASNPQIIKSYAAGESQCSKELLISTASFSFYLMFLIGLPIIYVAEPIVNIWLGQVPAHSVIFLQIAIITSIVDSMNNSFYTALCAVGKIKRNSILTALVSVMTLPAGYLFFKMGASPVAIAYIILIDDMLLSYVVKPIVLIKDASYSWSDIIKCYIPCMKVASFAVPVSLFLSYYIDRIIESVILANIFIFAITIFCVAISVWYIGMDKSLREKIMTILKSKIKI